MDFAFKKVFKLGCSSSKTKKSIVEESRTKIPTTVRAKRTYLRPRIFLERNQDTSYILNRTEVVQEAELIIPRVPSPRAGTSASFQDTRPDNRKERNVQAVPRAASKKGKAWKRPAIRKPRALTPEPDESEYIEIDSLNQTVEFFYGQKRLHVYEEAKQTRSGLSASCK